MSQYQSFPDAAGHSQTVDKLKALRLPDMAGKSFLDVGCNEGFFVGFAKFQGAARAVGVDRSAYFLDRARTRFPDCEFLERSWDELPEDRFDVILLASALHYASDQAGLVARLMDRLADDGLLIIELGIASSSKTEWVKVKRGIDEREFPSMAMLKKMLADYAWKWMGPSINQQGDPVARHVIHVSRRKPVAYLLMEPPGYGKSSLAERLFHKVGMPVVSGDQQISRVARSELAVPAGLEAAIREDFSPFRIDQTMQRVFDRGLVSEMVSVWLSASGVLRSQDLVIDAYVPPEYHQQVIDEIALMGYMPVHLQWRRPGIALLPEKYLDRRADEFYLSLLEPADGADRPAFTTTPAGFVDEVSVQGEYLVVRGWAVDGEGNLPKVIEIRVRGRTVAKVDDMTVEMRLDVQQHLSLPHALVGFRAMIEMEEIQQAWEIRDRFSIRVPGGVDFQFSGPVDAVFRRTGR